MDEEAPPDVRSPQEALEEAEERFRAAFEHAPIGMAIVATDGRYLRVNRSFCDITGYPPEELIGRTIPEITHEADQAADREYMRRLLSGEIERYTLEKRYVHSTGGTVWARLNVSVVRTAQGQPVHVLKQIEDISERKAVEERLLYQALHDPLTNLHNRLRFMDRLQHALARSERKRTPVAVLFVDLDHFKGVNDRYGHRAGDELLIAMARTLERGVRPMDTVARLGGDEFAVLCEELTNERDAVLIADRLCGAIQQPVEIDGTLISITASIGIAFAQEGDDSHTLLKHADAAMYQVKEGERGNYEIYLDALETSGPGKNHSGAVGLATGGQEMDRNDETRPEHPAAPEQVESGFETGQERPDIGDEAEEAHEGRFSEGQEDLPEGPEAHKKGRFSEGEEDLPETPEKEAERRFSEGQEHIPPD